jgi:hypothetical protein
MARAGGDETDDRYAIHVLTMDPGDDLFSRFGHIALVVEDKSYKAEKVYNYGTFDFTDPNLRLTYARGDLNFWLSVWDYSLTLEAYTYFNQTTVKRTLNLSNEQSRELVRLLRTNALPSNRTYSYRHYLDNCCTRIRDILDKVTGGALSEGRQTNHTSHTFRYWTRKSLHRLPVMNTLISFVMGSTIDKPITRYDEQFLPSVLAKDMDASYIGLNKEPLVLKKKTVLERRGPHPDTQSPTSDIVIIVVLFLALALGFIFPIVHKNSSVTKRILGFGLFIWGLLAGLGGLVLFLFWVGTTHYDIHQNENLLIMPPFHLWLIGPGLKLMFVGRVKPLTAVFIKKYLVVCMGLIVLDLVLKIYPFIQDNYQFILFSSAINILALLSLQFSGLLEPFPKN